MIRGLLPALVLASVTSGLAGPALAQSHGADGNWQCNTLMGREPVAFVGLTGDSYVLTLPDGTQDKGSVAYSDSPIVQFDVTSGGLLGLDAVDGVMVSDETLMFHESGGGIRFMCYPGLPGKMR